MALFWISDEETTMNSISIIFFILSLGAHLWLLVDVDPMRETCTGLRDETILTAVLNILTFLMGACCMRMPCANFILVALSALVTVFASRLTLFIYEVKHICGGEIASAPAGDILTDLGVYDRAVLSSWAGLILFAAGVLLAHTKINWSFLNCFGDSRQEKCPRAREQYRDKCDDERGAPVGASTWIRVN